MQTKISKKIFKMHKILLLLICIFLIFLLETPCLASSQEEETGRYIITDTLSSEIEDYAQTIFQTLDVNDFRYLNLTVSLENVKLSKGFKVTMQTSQEYEKFYFPILDGENVIATLIINDIEGELSFILLRDEVTESINNLESTKEAPAEIIVSDYAVYAVTDDSVAVLGEDFYSDENTVLNEIDTLQSEAASYTEDVILSICSQNVYDVELDTISTVSVVGRSCDNFPIVANKSVNGSGTCWASCTAAIIEYINNGSSSTSSSAAEIRDEILTSQTSGNINDAKSYIKSYTGESLSKKTTYLSWSALKKQILSKDNPCYMRLKNTATSKYHATVLVGYDYNNSDDSDYRMYIMDPNITTGWVKTSYGSTYTASYGSVYSWVATLYKS